MSWRTVVQPTSYCTSVRNTVSYQKQEQEKKSVLKITGRGGWYKNLRVGALLHWNLKHSVTLIKNFCQTKNLHLDTHFKNWCKIWDSKKILKLCIRQVHFFGPIWLQVSTKNILTTIKVISLQTFYTHKVLSESRKLKLCCYNNRSQDGNYIMIKFSEFITLAKFKLYYAGSDSFIN